MSRYHFISGVMCGWRGSEHPPPTSQEFGCGNRTHSWPTPNIRERVVFARPGNHFTTRHKVSIGVTAAGIHARCFPRPRPRPQNDADHHFGAGAIFGQVTNGLDIPESASVKMALFCAPDVTMRIFCIRTGCRRCRRSSWATIDSKSSSKYSNPIPNMSRSGFDPQLNHELRNSKKKKKVPEEMIA